MLSIVCKSQKGSPTNEIIVEASGEKQQTTNVYTIKMASSERK